MKYYSNKDCFVVERTEWEEDHWDRHPLWVDRHVIGVFTDLNQARSMVEEEIEGTDYDCAWKPGKTVYSGIIDHGGAAEGIRYEITRSQLFR